MANTWLIGDTHFGHQNILRYTRPQYASIDEHDEDLIERWNTVVRPADTVWHLGDVLFPARCFDVLPRLNGNKKLVMGNHDVFPLARYAEHFTSIKPYKKLAGAILSHIPVHECQKSRFVGNIHGHMHEKCLPGRWYLNVSAEQTGLAPMALDEALSRLPSNY